MGIISYFLEVYHNRNIDTVVLQFPKVSRGMSPPVISLFLFSNVRFSFHTTENKAGDPFKMAEEEYGSGLGKRVAELLLVERFLWLTFRNADQRAMLGTWEHGNMGTGGVESREMAGTRGAGRKHEGLPNGLSGETGT